MGPGERLLGAKVEGFGGLFEVMIRSLEDGLLVFLPRKSHGA